MKENLSIRPERVIGPLGESLTLDSLPPPETTRWVVRRKAEVVAAVSGGLLSVDEACERYSLTLEEFAGWQRAIDRAGMPGLRVTRIKQYRDLYEQRLLALNGSPPNPTPQAPVPQATAVSPLELPARGKQTAYLEIPAATVGAAFFYTWASMMLGKKIFTRLGMKDIPGMPPLERWELPRFFLGLYVLAFAMQYITNRNATLEMIQYNLGLACVLVFWLQGLAALWWMPRKYPFVRPLRWIIAVLSVIIGMVQMIVVLLGLSDMVLQYRKKRNYE